MSRELASDQPGYFEIFEGPGASGWYFKCNCPCGCPYPDIVPVNRRGDWPTKAHAWNWDGNLTHPTITPSFKRHTPCRIHFNLTGGVYEIHADGAPAAPNCYRATP